MKHNFMLRIPLLVLLSLSCNLIPLLSPVPTGPATVEPLVILTEIPILIITPTPTKVFTATPDPNSLPTGITDIATFLDQCPTNDPAYAQIRSDLPILLDGQPIADPSCSEPFTQLPIDQFSHELITLQVLRVSYYMDPGIPDHLPWTSLNLYNWLVESIGGINLKTESGQLYCCDEINGEQYISQSIQSDEQRDFKRDWIGISSTLAYYVHEARHADAGVGHVTGCEAFPNPDDYYGCDQSYDLVNLGSYGVQYWLNEAWMTGWLNIGISCSAEAEQIANGHVGAMNNFMDRFVDNIPPLVEEPPQPYGGPCLK